MGTMLDSLAKVRNSHIDGHAGALLQDAEATDKTGQRLDVDDVVRWTAETARRQPRRG
jgi:hypothetical protein